MRTSLSLLIALLFVHGCAVQPSHNVPQAAGRTPASNILTVPDFIQQGWRYYPVKGHTAYKIISMDDRLAIQATGAGGAGGLIRTLPADAPACRTLHWGWRLERLQPSADLTRKEGDDVAASIFVLFGDPGFLSSPNEVPTIRYVWSTARHAKDAVVANPYMPELVKNIVVRAGPRDSGRWLSETRDLAADFRRAFGRDPDSPVRAVAIFTDNDQTGEPVTAYYERIACS